MVYHIHYSPTFKQKSICIQLIIRAIKNDNATSVDKDQAFAQGINPKRNIYIRPSNEFFSPRRKLLCLVNYVNGTVEAGNAWDVRITNFIKNVLQLQWYTSNSPLFFEEDLIHNSKVTLSKFFDDFIFVCNKEFHKHIAALKTKYAQTRSITPFTYSAIFFQKYTAYSTHPRRYSLITQIS